jgi:hypothetical protein
VILLKHSNVFNQAMIACCYSSFIFILIFISLSSICFAYERSSAVDDENKINEEKWQTNDDQYIDQPKYHKASYQHEQNLLTNIYAPNRNYISMHDDRIHPSNFTYFTFNNLGTYRFILISLRGDADLYISTRNKHVTYDNYEYSSCTCGIDELLIDPYLKRPIYIGIYGYSQYRISHYRLLIELVDSTIPLDLTYTEKSNDEKTYANIQEQSTSRTNQKASRVTVEGEEDRRHLLWNILLWLLNFLVEVLT